MNRLEQIVTSVLYAMNTALHDPVMAATAVIVVGCVVASVLALVLSVRKRRHSK